MTTITPEIIDTANGAGIRHWQETTKFPLNQEAHDQLAAAIIGRKQAMNHHSISPSLQFPYDRRPTPGP